MSTSVHYYFVGGAARSGTTLLQSILCSDQSTNPLISEATPVILLLENYENMVKQCKLYPGMYFDSVGDVKHLYARYLSTLLSELKRKYSCERLVLKSPQLTRSFPLIYEFLQGDVKFLCMVRDPRAAIASMLEWGERARQRSKRHFFQNRNMNELTKFYNSFYEPVVQCEDEALKERVTYIRYEDLVSEPERIVDDIREFTGLAIEHFDPTAEWKKTNIDFHDERLPQRDAITELYGKPVSSTRISAYKNILTNQEIETIEKRCSFIFDAFGYEKHYAELPQLRYKAKKYDELLQELPKLRYKAEKYDELARELPELRNKAKRYDKLMGKGLIRAVVRLMRDLKTI